MVDRIYGQYRTKPKAVEWYNIVPTISDELLTAYDDIKATYDIDSQAGVQLDVIGRVIAQPRNITFPISLTVSECGDDTKECGDSTATEFSALTGFDNVGLTDEEYKLVLKSKIQINTSDVTIDGIITAINTTLSDSFVSQLNDNEDMTFDIVITGTLTATEISLLNSIGFIPKPQGVGFGGYVNDVPVEGVGTNFFDWTAIAGTTGLNRSYALAVDEVAGDVWIVSDDATTSPANGGDIRVLRGGTLPYETGVAAADNPVWNNTRHMAIHGATGDLWVGGQNLLFVFRGGVAPAEDAGWLGSDISGLAVDQSDGTLFVNTSVQARIDYILEGDLNNPYTSVTGWHSNPNRNSEREVAIDPNASRMYVVNVDNNPVLTDVWTRLPYVPDSWVKSGDSPYTTQENTVGFDRNYDTGDMLISLWDTGEIMLNKNDESTWRVAGSLPNATGVITVKYNSITGEAWCCDVLTNIVYSSPAIVQLVKTIDSLGSVTDGTDFYRGFGNEAATPFGTMADATFANVAITEGAITWDTGVLVPTFKLVMNDDTLTSSYVTSVTCESISGAFDQLDSFVAGAGVATWIFSSLTITKGNVDTGWPSDGIERDFTLKLI